MYLRTARLDLDNYNHDTDDGLHITSMAGTWMSVVYGFAGVRLHDKVLIINPLIPAEWKKYSFKIIHLDAVIHVAVYPDHVEIENLSNHQISLNLYGEEITLSSHSTIEKRLMDPVQVNGGTIS